MDQATNRTTGGATDGAGALAGLRVIDLTRVLGGPYCTMILGDHGAEVIKVEPPQGDETREWGPPFHDHGDGTRDAAYFLGVNRNKRALSLDIGQPEGREALLRLLDGADVLIENFKPGAMERWGLGHDALAARFPGLVHCRISGFGADGPLGSMPGYDAVVQAMVGLMSINGSAETGPLRLGTPAVDLATGLYAAVGILMALHERARSGLGQFVDMTLHDCGLALLHPAAANFFLNGKRPTGMGNAHPNIAPYETFRTATCDIFLAIGNDGQFRKLCDLLDRAPLAADPRFTTNGDRVAHRAVLAALLDESLRDADGRALAERLLAAGLPAGPVLGVDEALSAPHTRHRDMVIECDGVRTLGTPIKLSRTPGRMRSGAPRFAADAEAVLRARGYKPEEIAALRAAGVLATTRRR